MPSKFAADCKAAVSCKSALLGVGSPEGWLWATMIASASTLNASRNTSRNSTAVVPRM